MPKDTESTFLDVLKGFGLLGSGVASVVGLALESIGFAGKRAMRSTAERDAIKKLGAHYDTDEVAAKNAQLARAAGFPSVQGYMEGFYERLTERWLEAKFVPAPEVRSGLLVVAGELYGAEGLHEPLPKPS